MWRKDLPVERISFPEYFGKKILGLQYCTHRRIGTHPNDTATSSYEETIGSERWIRCGQKSQAAKFQSANRRASRWGAQREGLRGKTACLCAEQDRGFLPSAEKASYVAPGRRRDCLVQEGRAAVSDADEPGSAESDGAGDEGDGVNPGGKLGLHGFTPPQNSSSTVLMACDRVVTHDRVRDPVPPTQLLCL